MRTKLSRMALLTALVACLAPSAIRAQQSNPFLGSWMPAVEEGRQVFISSLQVSEDKTFVAKFNDGRPDINGTYTVRGNRLMLESEELKKNRQDLSLTIAADGRLKLTNGGDDANALYFVSRGGGASSNQPAMDNQQSYQPQPPQMQQQPMTQQQPGPPQQQPMMQQQPGPPQQQSYAPTQPAMTQPKQKKSFLDKLNDAIQTANTVNTMVQSARRRGGEPLPDPDASVEFKAGAMANTGWFLTSMTVSGATDKPLKTPQDVRFCDDGGWVIHFADGSKQNGTYELKEDQLIMKSNDGSLFSDCKMTQNGDELTLHDGNYVLHLKYRGAVKCS